MSSGPLLTRSFSPALQVVRLISRAHVGQVIAAVAAAGSAAATVATSYSLRHAHRHDGTSRRATTSGKGLPAANSTGKRSGGKAGSTIALPDAFDGIPMGRSMAPPSKATWDGPGSFRASDWS